MNINKHNTIKKTRNIYFRFVNETDAGFILELRTNKGKARYISEVDANLEKQEEWIQRYKLREFEKCEYYFVILTACGVPVGLVRLYDFVEESFCWGSWILKDDAPIYAAIESALTVYEIAFNDLGFVKSHFDVRKANLNVVKFHKRFGATIESEDELNYYFIYTLESYKEMRMKYGKFFHDPA